MEFVDIVNVHVGFARYPRYLPSPGSSHTSSLQVGSAVSGDILLSCLGGLYTV